MMIVDTIVNAIDGILDKFIPDANVREQVKAQIQNQVYEMAKLDADDRASARRREIETKDTTTRELAYVYTFGYFGALGALLFGWVNVPSDMHGLIDVLFGVLTAGQYSIMAFYFGSSSGSQNKDSIIARLNLSGISKP